MYISSIGKTKNFLHKLKKNLFTFYSKYSTGTPEALFDAFQKEVDSDKSITLNVKEIMNSWTTQSGFPVLNVNFNGNKVNYTQERFYLRRSKNEEATWAIPLNWATKSSPNFTDTRKIQLLNTKSGEITIENADKDWVIFNLQQTGKVVSFFTNKTTSMNG